jgi:hypothetical protein
MEIGASVLSPYTLIAANVRVIGPRIQSRFFSSTQILEPYHLARGETGVPTGNTVSRILAWSWHCVVSDIVMSSSLEDRIRLLTDRAIAAKTQSELDAVLPELKAAIRDHIRYLRAIAVETIPEAFGKSKTAA